MPRTHNTTDANARSFRLALFLALGLLLLALAAPSLAADAPAAAATTADDGRSWGAFFGRTHVLFLHLPIGLLIGAFAIEFFGLFRRSKGYDVAAAWLFVLGFLSSVVAVVTGLLLGTEQATDKSLNVFTLLFADADKGVSETMGLHMWLGVTLMVLAGVAALLKIIAVNKQWPDDSPMPERGGWPLGVARLGLLGVMAALPLVGHLGGNMTHGPKYLFEKAPAPLGDIRESIVYWPEKAPQERVVKGGDGQDFKPDGSVAAWYGVIQPALNDSCVKCHGPSKQNADIRLDSLVQTVKGEALDYPVLTNKDAQRSALYTVISLPKSHDMFMPPDPKDALDAETVAFIGEWIQKFEGRLEDPDAPAKPEPVAGTNTNPKPNTNPTPNPAKPLIDPAAIRAIEDAGGSAQSLSQEESPELLTVKFAYLKTLNPEAVAMLGNTAGQVARLDFQGSAFNDAAAQQLPELANLTTLNLKDTQLTDTGLGAMPQLPKLEWLNLFGTGVTDQGLDALKRYKGLKKLYLTGTAVTEEGVVKLRAALPDTEVYSDFDQEFSFKLPEPDAPADATPVNAVCPVSGKPIAAGFTSEFDGKLIGFCCGNCKAAFDKEPAKFEEKITPAEE